MLSISTFTASRLTESDLFCNSSLVFVSVSPGMEERSRKRSTISHLVAPIVSMGRKLSPSIGRKLSRRDRPEDCELGTEISENVVEFSIPIDSDLDISDEFISQMREVFREFDKVGRTPCHDIDKYFVEGQQWLHLLQGVRSVTKSSW